MPKYRIREEYILDTKVTNKPFLKELISTNCIDNRDIQEYRCDISDNEDGHDMHEAIHIKRKGEQCQIGATTN